MTSLLLSPPSNLSETNSNLRILRDSVFQLNSDFISNSNLNPSGLLPRPYISLGAPPPRIPLPIPSQNRVLAATRVPPPSPPPPLFQSHPFKLNHVPVVKSQRPNHRKKESRQNLICSLRNLSPKSCCCSSPGCDFSDELEVNPALPVSSPCRTLASGLYGYEIGCL
jgi:hypothetical protein